MNVGGANITSVSVCVLLSTQCGGRAFILFWSFTAPFKTRMTHSHLSVDKNAKNKEKQFL